LPSSSNFANILAAPEPTIFVTTIAAISVLHSRSTELGYNMADLFAPFACVLIDEGHYEPAHKWSQAIRSLRRPTLLLTGTPYRNDEKFFQIGREWRYRFSHHEAEEQRFLRVPQFETVATTQPTDFVNQVHQLSQQFSRNKESSRAIVRCKDAESVRAIVDAFQHIGVNDVVGVHERFPTGPGRLVRDVPGPDTEARYWVHQNKMIEGIDDPRFRILAFYNCLGNDRAVVQQIGRVLRNPRQDEHDMTALVISRGDRDVARIWGAYKRFDHQDEPNSVATVPDLVSRVLEAQPEAFYYDGAYRTRIDLDDPFAWEAFAFPLRTRVYRCHLEAIPPLRSLEEPVLDQWRELDRSLFTTQRPDQSTIIIPYITAENSPLLRTGIFIEPTFGYTVIRLVRDMLFLYDARGRTPKVVLDHFRPMSPDKLQSLFPQGPASLTSVSLLNTDIGRQAPRSRQLRASAIEELAPDLADYAYVCSIAEGYTEINARRCRRYVGLSKSRVSDYLATERDYATYSAWLDALDRQLAAAARGVTTFERYAQYAPVPADATPTHVLLDIDRWAFARTEGGVDAPLELEDTALAVEDGRTFTLVVGGEECDTTIDWDKDRSKYVVESPALRALRFIETDGDQRELLSAINDDQAIRVVPAARESLYSHGHFFRPVLPLQRQGAFRLLDVLHPVAELGQVGSEKGRAIVENDWAEDSVFGLISALNPASARKAPQPMASLFDDPELLLCTDLGTEICDFVALQGERVALMHAKAPTRATYCSASALHDVASQAIKNLPYLQPITETRPPISTWTRPWNPGGLFGQTHRLRVGNFESGTDMWARVRTVISDPNSQREVWLVIGRGLSKDTLIQEAGKRPPSPEAMQVFSLLQTTWGAVSQLGARLRVFCSP
jgi:hypothetical protein